ncbi:hypothetical protein Adi01nite_05910 [Amorphoplanes digitatis]|uniref:Uncharacterized protein n=1 Tax=Actinoplanes digitatis TaxID=1868 RepID=A0A7W7I1W0_9ACTN|nr:hypothetical protein [Actinoplanes digitatis]MBB4764865.1 hypothetical protein [Actinoplanes digitatis]BFE74459.1 hypothetical protein GCM10020092_077600 [Actinoplanes digitatis]GID91179.1 hypothetical protein Adi01nite_05910 [Actinoplanes digitatis]
MTAATRFTTRAWPPPGTAAASASTMSPRAAPLDQVSTMIRSPGTIAGAIDPVGTAYTR